MSIVKPTLNIDLFKMEKAFFTGYREGEKAFYISSTNWKGEEEEVCLQRYLEFINVELDKSLSEDLNIYWLSRKCFHVWDNIHHLQAW